MIIKQSVKHGIHVYVVGKDMSDDEIKARAGTFFDVKDFKHIIRHDADVYTDEGRLLLRLRKGVLPQKNIEAAYNALIKFAHNKVRTRGIASGSEKTDLGNTNEVMSNIIGYFDKRSIFEKRMLRLLGLKSPFKVRLSSFNRTQPDKWKQTIPLIQDIDRMYKKLVPKQHKAQRKLAKSTAYHIPGTAFTTVTTNVNFQTALHTDKGDFTEGFGNLVVIEKGKYEGGYTGFPQYGVAVDVRNGDFLAMDVHRHHANTKIIPKSKDAIRLSLVSYLREGVVEKSKGTKPDHIKRNLAFHTKALKMYKVALAKAKEGKQKKKTHSGGGGDSISRLLKSGMNTQVKELQRLNDLFEQGKDVYEKK